ncbi:hypothetical protein ACHQM5_000138 [Ranunculus cassubicifolius]
MADDNGGSVGKKRKLEYVEDDTGRKALFKKRLATLLRKGEELCKLSKAKVFIDVASEDDKHKQTWECPCLGSSGLIKGALQSDKPPVTESHDTQERDSYNVQPPGLIKGALQSDKPPVTESHDTQERDSYIVQPLPESSEFHVTPNTGLPVKTYDCAICGQLENIGRGSQLACAHWGHYDCVMDDRGNPCRFCPF